MLKYLLILMLFFGNYLNAETFSKEASNEPILVQKGEEKHWCPVCGMNIKKFYKTSHTSTLENGTPRQYCSIRCLAKDKEEYGIDENNIKVIDAKHEKLIDAKKAFYVIGSKVKGTMSMTSKLAFEKELDAKEFIKQYGGKIASFAEALKEAQNSLKEDDKNTKNKKIKKIYPMGKKIFEKLCNQDIDPTDYIEINELKADIKNNKLCKRLDEKKLQAVSLYLWDVKRFGDLDSIKNKVEVEEREKCPVCGMFVAKYPRWAAQIFYKHGDHEHKFSFDGVKDMMKFYFNPKKWGEYPVSKDMISKILVTDYYSQEAIDGIKAFYVIGSDVYGPMGNELIPFISENDAKIFKNDHDGTKIVSFDKIIENEVYKLDE
ncbi:nitrous oxide reductase accessory protein NosL [Arcobacter arenosus]|nr:nitrous oxide reductase accessory protein NosL [Arcobacter arenosus]